MKKKVIKISLFAIFITILTVFGIFNLINNISTAANGETSTQSSAKPGTLIDGPIPSSYGTAFGSWETKKLRMGIPLCGVFDQVYCQNRGADFNHTGSDVNWQIEYADALALVGKKYSSAHGHASTPHDGELTPLEYYQLGTSKLTAYLAYVVSDNPIDGWSQTKQWAIWDSMGQNNGSAWNYDENGNKVSINDAIDSLVANANNYSTYHQSVEPYSGLQPLDATGKAITKVDQTTGEYTVGPFNMTYTNGIYGGLAFSGITDMKVIGYNKSKAEVTRIDIKQFVIGDEKITPNYFEPDPTLKVDSAANQIYPKSNESFDVVFDNPNSNDVNDESRVEYISIYVKFQYMLAYGEKTDYEGHQYEVKYSHDEKKHKDLVHNDRTYTYTDADGKPATGTDHSGDYYEDCFSCKTECFLKDYNQQPVSAMAAKRFLYEQELILTPDGGTDITMDIKGRVWEDEKSGKETLADGERADSEKPVNNIPVILYDDKDKVVEQTATDNEGKYKFEKLDAMRKYYVEFKYNGQQYENTIYTDKLDDKHSVATETTSDRDSFNKKFEEIDGDEGYTVEQLRYDDQRSQYYNAPGIFTLSAFTGSDGKTKEKLIKYPKHDKFVIEEVEKTVAGTTYKAVYDDEDSIKHIDFGITQRIEFDMALKKDLYVATVKINGKTEVYGYDKKLANSEDGQQANSDAGYAEWTINVVGGYERSLDDADWNFKGQNGNKDGLLEVYATYKVAVRNQSMSMLGHVTKVYDYYDSTFEYVPSLSWQSKTNYKNNKATRDKLQDSIEKGNVSEWGETPKASDDKNGTITVDVNKKQETGETQYIYLTFKLKNDSNGQVSLGDKTNKAEIGAFKTYYKGGKTTLPHYNGENSYTVTGDDMIAGRVDRDSIPSSMGKDGKPGKNELYDEDDEDTAPTLNVKLTGDKRKLNGTAWEDERTVNEGNAMIGNGIMDNRETKIAGIKVELVEKTVWDKNNPTGEYVWATTTTASDGTYKFESYIPGDYVIRFTYGEGLSGTKENNGKSYNGQDYKTTTYQAGIDQTPTTDLDGKYKGYLDVNNQNETGTYGFNIATKKDNVSDAKDIWSVREEINNYSKTNVTNGIAEILAIPYEKPSYNSDTENDAMRQKLINHTTATAESGVVVVEVERNLQSESENGNPSYKLENLNIGLVERPKAQLEIDKFITNIKVTLANNTVLFDVNKKGDNVVWKEHAEYNLADKKKNNKYEEYYGKNGKHRYSYREEVDKLVRNADKGLVQLSMDEELMHGATIEITYNIKVTNVGEVDYDGKAFYYKGEKSGNVVTTNANQVIDYVANNLQFNSTDSRNNGWSVISQGNLKTQNLVNGKLQDKVSKFNTIIQTSGLSGDLEPGDVKEKTLVLSQLITAENKSDDLTYRNITEIVKTSNTVGRRMAYSVVGNQDPTVDAQEVDASVAEKVIILPPFGSSPIYYILGITIGLILIGGITLIIRKVLRK